jgi:hypothetical protein
MRERYVEMVEGCKPFSRNHAPHIINDISLWMEASRSPANAGVESMLRSG